MRKVQVPELKTDRLRLRMWTKKDAYDLYEYASNPIVGYRAGWKPHESVEETRQIISTMLIRHIAWAIEDKDTGKVIGSIGFNEDNFRPAMNCKELGYSLSEKFWGRGIMTEAAKRLVRYAFENLNVDILTIKTSEDNKESQRVIEKCGFVYEGTLRRACKLYDGSVQAVRCYSILHEEYRRMKNIGSL